MLTLEPILSVWLFQCRSSVFLKSNVVHGIAGADPGFFKRGGTQIKD